MLDEIWHWTKLATSAVVFGFAAAHLINNGVLFWNGTYSRWILGVTILCLAFSLVLSAWSAFQEWSTYEVDKAFAASILVFYFGRYWVMSLEQIGLLFRKLGLA